MTGTEPRTRVLLADDNVPVRLGLKRLISEEPDMEVIAETSDAQEALRLAKELSPDVALVDVSMPGWDGVRLAHEMSAACLSLKVIAVTRHNDRGFVKKMLEAGACGYVLKQNAASTLVPAVRACVRGATYVDPSVQFPDPPPKIDALPRASQPDGEPLTAIESKVLQLFGAAVTLQQIGEQVGLDREEVARVKNAAMQKLGFSNRLQVLNYVRSRATTHY